MYSVSVSVRSGRGLATVKTNCALLRGHTVRLVSGSQRMRVVKVWEPRDACNTISHTQKHTYTQVCLTVHVNGVSVSSKQGHIHA